MGNNSFASKANDYVTMQGKVEGGRLHIQGIGPKVNRYYGVSADMTAPQELLTWFAAQPRTGTSGNGASKPTYTPIQVAVRGDGLRFQVKGSAMNRPYGAAFNGENKEVRKFITRVVEAEQAQAAADAAAKVKAAQEAVKAAAAKAKAASVKTDITLA